MNILTHSTLLWHDIVLLCWKCRLTSVKQTNKQLPLRAARTELYDIFPITDQQHQSAEVIPNDRKAALLMLMELSHMEVSVVCLERRGCLLCWRRCWVIPHWQTMWSIYSTMSAHWAVLLTTCAWFPIVVSSVFVFILYSVRTPAVIMYSLLLQCVYL